MVKLVYTFDLRSNAGNGMRVRVSPGPRKTSNTLAQQGRAADENPRVGSSILSRMNGNDNSRHVRVWFANLFCLGSSVGRAADL